MTAMEEGERRFYSNPKVMHTMIKVVKCLTFHNWNQGIIMGTWSCVNDP